MSKNNFTGKLNALQNVLKTLPAKVGAEAVSFFKQRFREQAWVGDRTEPWKKRKETAIRNKGRAILIDSGRLRRSIRVIRHDSRSVTIGTDVPYAQAHNEGFSGVVSVRAHRRDITTKTKSKIYNISTRKSRTITTKHVTGDTQVQAHTRRMNLPKRQFMGNSQYLWRRIDRMITAEIKKSLK